MPDLLATLRRWAENISPGGIWSHGGHAGRWCLNLDYELSKLREAAAEIERLKAEVELGYQEEAANCAKIVEMAARVTNLEAEIERVMAVVHAWEAELPSGGEFGLRVAAERIRNAIQGKGGS